MSEVLALLYGQFAVDGMTNCPSATSPLKAACERIENGTMNDGLGIFYRYLEQYNTIKDALIWINLKQQDQMDALQQIWLIYLCFVEQAGGSTCFLN